MVPDVKKENVKLDIKPTYLDFSGYSETKKATYAVKLEFYKEIDVAESKTNHSQRCVEFVLQKKDLEEEYWPRLLKDKAKMHFLKTDFDKVGCQCEQRGMKQATDSLCDSGSTRMNRTR